MKCHDKTHDCVRQLTNSNLDRQKLLMFLVCVSLASPCSQMACSLFKLMHVINQYDFIDKGVAFHHL